MAKLTLVEFRVKVFAPDGPCDDELNDALRLVQFGMEVAVDHLLPNCYATHPARSLLDDGFTVELTVAKE